MSASEAVRIAGPAGALEALIEYPASPAGASVAVICHPHPLHGGTMQNKVVHTLARAAVQAGWISVRFNYRGVGASAGLYDHGRGETHDALAVVADVRQRWPAAALLLGGFSFGGMVAYLTAREVGPAALIMVAPAVALAEFEPHVAADTRGPTARWLIVQGEADDVVHAADVAAFAGRFTPSPQLVRLPGVGHFFHGQLHALRSAAEHFLKT